MYLKQFYSHQIPVCTSEKMACISNVTINGPKCYKKCSGLIVTSYTEHEMEDKFQTDLLKYLFEKDLSLYNQELKGLSLCTI